VLLLDEPMAGVPAAETGRLMEIMEALPAELAIVMIEHDMHVVRRFASEVLVLVAGRVLVRGQPQEVMASDEVRRVYLGSARRDAPTKAAHA
jgi:branched-chain amino acid transport system ATP-binding protein